jgi:hypothetical protein
MERRTKHLWKTGILLAAFAALAARPAVAHEHGDRAMGVVASITTDRIVIKTADGHPVTFIVTSETRFFRGESPAHPQDVRPGERAVVHGKRAGEALQATQVRLGPAPPAK